MGYSIEEVFETSIDDDLAWRRIELQVLAGEVRRAVSNNSESPLSRALVRSMSTMLYAHWEGFARQLLDSYAHLLLRLKPAASEVNDALAIQHIRQVFVRLNSGDASAGDELLSMLRGKPAGRIRLSRAALSDTKANLRFKVLCQLLSALGVNDAEFMTKDKLIDTMLCDRRNTIAHGRASFPDAEEVLEVWNNVIEMMERLRDIFVGEVRRHGYKNALSDELC